MQIQQTKIEIHDKNPFFGKTFISLRTINHNLHIHNEIQNESHTVDPYRHVA